MKNDRKIYLVAVIACLMLLAGSLVLTYSMAVDGRVAEEIPVAAKPAGQGYISFRVEDGETGDPLKGVDVVVLETKKQYSTNEKGESDKITVPIIHDGRFDDILEKPWGEANVLFYKEGYAPYALFYVQVTENNYRKDVRILMFKTSSLSSDKALSIIEGPDRLWVDSIVKKYRPN